MISPCPDGRPKPCRSQRCPCEACRRKYAQKEAAVLRRSFRDKRPDYNLTLRLTDDQPKNDRQLAGYLKKFTQKVRDLRKALQASIEYYINIEFSDGQPHLHMTVITSLDWTISKMKAVVKEWWSSSCPDRQITAVYCDTIHNAIGLANYLPKNLKDRRPVEMPPEAWNSRTCRLVWLSRGFLTKRKSDLWREQCQEWYPQPAAAPQTKTVTLAASLSPTDARYDRPGRYQTAFIPPRRALGHCRQRESRDGAGKRPDGWFNPLVWLLTVRKPRGP